MKENKQTFLRSKHLIILLFVVLGGACVLIFYSATIIGYFRAYSLLRNESAFAADNQYTIMEENLRIQMENYESLHPEYNEYFYELDEIGHDTYELISILSVLHGNLFSFAEVQGSLDVLFHKQYIVTETIRTTRRHVKGKETNYYVCTVKLEKQSFDQIATSLFNREEYAEYNERLRFLVTLQ